MKAFLKKMDSKLSVLYSVYEDIKEMSTLDQKEIEKLKSENSVLKDSLNSFYQENVELKVRLNSMGKSDEKLTAKVQNLEKSIGEKDEELELLRAHVKILQQIQDSCLHQIDVKHKELTASNEEIDKMKKELEDRTRLSEKLNVKIVIH